MGEYRFGAYAGHPDFVGITLGTGMGSGIIKNGSLIPDAHCCSGEFGTMPYLDGIYENYTSGHVFQTEVREKRGRSGRRSSTGEAWAQEALQRYGRHLGNAIKTIIMAVDPPLDHYWRIGGQGHGLYQEAMWESIREIPFPFGAGRFPGRVYRYTKNIAITGCRRTLSGMLS